MITIIAGSRDIKDQDIMNPIMNGVNWEITEVVSGHAIGVDKMGEVWAKENEIPSTIFKADWKRFGKRAGHLRNKQMAEYADALVAIWDGKSLGTKNMIETAIELELQVQVIHYEDTIDEPSEKFKNRIGL